MYVLCSVSRSSALDSTGDLDDSDSSSEASEEEDQQDRRPVSSPAPHNEPVTWFEDECTLYS